MGQDISQIDSSDIQKMLQKFGKLDEDQSGALSAKEFMQIPELTSNPLVERIIDIFDTDGNGEVDFTEFIRGMNSFASKGDTQHKLRFAFNIYDIDKDGYITNAELFHVLKMMVGNNLLDDQLQQVVDKTIIYSDKDGDQRISFKEFCDAIGPSLREDIITHLNKITSDDK